MKIDITHGTYRILLAAKRYRTSDDAGEMTQPFDVTSLGVLLAMQDEEEYRVAAWLTESQIARQQIVEAFSFLTAEDSCENEASEQNAENHSELISGLRFFLDGDEVAAGSLTPELSAAIFDAVQRLYDVLPQLVLSTEHLLYALSLEEHEIGRFLRHRNVTPEQLFEKIRQLEGATTSEPEAVPILWEEIDGVSSDEEQIGKSHDSVPCRSRPSQSETVAVYRIMDASANRAIEAMRVLEDYTRFVLDDAQLLRETKQMRHELASALQALPHRERYASRDTVGDVGTTVEGANEYSRTSMADVLGANFSRLQESLRSLEEYGKLTAAQTVSGQPCRMIRLAQAVEQLRYRSYTLQKHVLLSLEKVAPNATEWGLARPHAKRLHDARLYVLIDCRHSEAEFVDLVQSVLSGGADVIQLRDKHADDRTLLQRAKRLRELTAAKQALMIVNDRPDLALLSHADGVHVGQDELSVHDVRNVIDGSPNTSRMLVGVSTHSIEQARQAVSDGADYIGVGPVFSSRTKQFDAFPGIDFLKQIASEMTLPAFAIGGVHLENLPLVVATGVRRVAVQSVVIESPNPDSICRQIKDCLTTK